MVLQGWLLTPLWGMAKAKDHMQRTDPATLGMSLGLQGLLAGGSSCE